MTTIKMSGEGIKVDREIPEAVAIQIMEGAIEDEVREAGPTVTLTLKGDGIQFDRELSEQAGVSALKTAIQEDTDGDADTEAGAHDRLPDDFFDRLSQKQRIMMEILLDADGGWMRGVDIRQKMREEYDLDVGEGGRATAGVIAGVTRKYGEDLRREVLPGRWADETQQHAEFSIGDKYRDEIEEWFDAR